VQSVGWRVCDSDDYRETYVGVGCHDDSGWSDVRDDVVVGGSWYSLSRSCRRGARDPLRSSALLARSTRENQ